MTYKNLVINNIVMSIKLRGIRIPPSVLLSHTEKKSNMYIKKKYWEICYILD